MHSSLKIVENDPKEDKKKSLVLSVKQIIVISIIILCVFVALIAVIVALIHKKEPKHSAPVLKMTTNETMETSSRVRLVGKSGSLEGRVEVYYEGKWGTICDDGWDDNNAAVVCGMLGYPRENAKAVLGKKYLNPPVSILLDEVRCNGTEDDISYCSSREWGEHNCDHDKDAGVLCPQTVRLVDGTPSQGQVEVYYGGKWRAVCSRDWDTNDAAVICSSLGYDSAVASAFEVSCTKSAQDVLGDLKCTGQEKQIHECPHFGKGKNECKDQRFAAVKCNTDFLTSFECSVSDDAFVDFDNRPVNVSAIAGTTAILECRVDLSEMERDKEITWISPRKTLIAIGDRRIIDDTRMSVERPDIPDWNLHIRNLRFDDRGLYTCNLNTKPMSIKEVNLTVYVKPDILEELSSRNQVVKEGDTAELVCNATGYPKPKIIWYRKKRNSLREKAEAIKKEGMYLLIHNITRHSGGIYECVAYNGIGPAVSKEIVVDVIFKPQVTVPNRRQGQLIGKETILHCEVSASPQAVIKWIKGAKVFSGMRYTNLYDKDRFTKVLSLRIHNITKSDFGKYDCEASNNLGRDFESMYLFEVHDNTIQRKRRGLLIPLTKYSIFHNKPEINQINIHRDKMKAMREDHNSRDEDVETKTEVGHSSMMGQSKENSSNQNAVSVFPLCVHSIFVLLSLLS